jgi:hypothetical protein
MKSIKMLAIGFVVSATTAACSPSQRELSRIEYTIPGNASSRTLDFQKIESNYLVCLGSGNSGVVESTLGHLIYMRVAFPNADLRETKTRLINLATHGYTRAIRQRAYVAMRVFADPQAFRGIIEAKHVSGDDIFSELMSRLEQ